MGLALHRRLHLLLDSLPFGEQHIEGEATHHIPQGRLAVLGNGEAFGLLASGASKFQCNQLHRQHALHSQGGQTRLAS